MIWEAEMVPYYIFIRSCVMLSRRVFEVLLMAERMLFFHGLLPHDCDCVTTLCHSLLDLLDYSVQSRNRAYSKIISRCIVIRML